MARSRRFRMAWLGVVVIALAAALVGAHGLGGRAAPRSSVREALVTTRVTRCTLTDSDSVDGRLGFGAAAPLPVRASGTITWLPAAGTIVTEGHQLLRVDDRPVVLLYGRLPQYRELDPPRPVAQPAHDAGARAVPDASAPSPRRQHGADVLELKAALRRLGYSGFGASDVYTGPTARAVRHWQRQLGEDTTGRVLLGDVFYAPSPLRVVPTAGVRPGDEMSTAALTSTNRTQVVTATVESSATWAQPGTAVTVTLASGRRVRGTVRSVSAPAAGSDPAGPTTTVVVAIIRQTALAHAGPPEVTVTHVERRRVGVLCVPVLALVALAEGGYGLQSADPARPGYLAVTTGMFAQGRVEVRGPGIAAGVPVLMPTAG